MHLMQQECYEQPTILKRLDQLNGLELAMFRELMVQKNPKHIVLAARGSSNNACQYFRYIQEMLYGLPVSFAATSIISMYHSHIDYDQALVIGVSQSGQAHDVLAVMKQAKEQKALTISITNDRSSPMAQEADVSFMLHANPELSVAATKTFTAELYVLAKIVSLLTHHSIDMELKKIPSLMGKVFAVEDSIKQVSKLFAPIKETFLLARGPLYSVALEGALKLLETAYMHATAYAISDFHHGPLAVVDENTYIIVFLEKGVMYQNTIDMIHKIVSSNGNLVVFTNDATFMGDYPTLYLPESGVVTSAFIFSVAIQLFAYHVSLAKGHNPDKPRNLSKVTITK